MRSGPAAVLVALSLASCRPSGPTSVENTRSSLEASSEARIDPEHIMSTIEALAADELGGRYSLHSDIDRAASVVIDRLTAAGVKPVGAEFRHRFDIAVGADLVSQGEGH